MLVVLPTFLFQIVSWGNPVASARKSDQIVKNFATSMSDNDLKFVTSRLFYQYQDDLAEVFNFFSELKKNRQLDNCDVDHWLGGAKSNCDLYKQVDQLSAACMREYERRGGSRLSLV